jgi:hypothetical protein
MCFDRNRDYCLLNEICEVQLYRLFLPDMVERFIVGAVRHFPYGNSPRCNAPAQPAELRISATALDFG